LICKEPPDIRKNTGGACKKEAGEWKIEIKFDSFPIIYANSTFSVTTCPRTQDSTALSKKDNFKLF
jgi:hypothetical protein